MRNIAKAFGIAMMLVLTALMIRAQSQSTAPPTPQWEIDAGGKMSFDVASVKQNTTAQSPSTSNVVLNAGDSFTPTGGLFSAANFPLIQYISFAYKLPLNQLRTMQAQLPKWANNDRFDIEARAAGNPTKDQFRLMMQALLADRFKLAVHSETQQLPVYALVLDKPGKLGPNLQPHPDDSPCSVSPVPGSGPLTTVAGGFPTICGGLISLPNAPPGRFRVGARNVPTGIIAASFNNPQTGIDHPILDQTGLTGKFDFLIEWTPEPNTVPNFQPDSTGPTFVQAVREQLGLKLTGPQTGPVDVFVLDRVEEPSPN